MIASIGQSCVAGASCDTGLCPNEEGESVVAPAHDLHLTYAVMGIDGRFIAAKVRYFKDDLENAVAKFGGRDSVSLGVDAVSDSLFERYVNTYMVVEQNGKKLTARVVGSGEDDEMWWYQLLYEAPEEVETLTITNKQLLELFRDQKNILKVENLQTKKKRSYYFAKGADTYKVAI